MDIYNLIRNWFNWCFENPERINPNHSAVYFFAIEHCNRLGWKEKFGFPSQMVMEAIGIKNWRTYQKTLMDLVDFGFIELIEKSKNQYSSNIISFAYVKNTKAQDKALDKALSKHNQKQHTKHSQSIVSIDKQLYNNTNLQYYNITEKPNFLEIKKTILSSQQWKESFLMNYKCNEDYLNSKLNEFFVMLENTGDTDKTEKEIKYYFTHWLKKKYPLQSKTNQPTFDPTRQYIDENGKIQVKVSR